MNYTFTDKIPDEIDCDPILISGADSKEFNRTAYLILTEMGTKPKVFEIKYESHSGPFKEAIAYTNLLAVGHEETFYLFDLNNKTNLLNLKMVGYFGHLYLDNEQFYVADANGLYCIDSTANVQWYNDGIAIDGVIIDEFTEDRIYGSGEWDPPGGWREFILDKKTGVLLR
jgi:hypothetical protein